MYTYLYPYGWTMFSMFPNQEDSTKENRGHKMRTKGEPPISVQISDCSY
jgi:hypothetical protein